MTVYLSIIQVINSLINFSSTFENMRDNQLFIFQNDLKDKVDLNTEMIHYDVIKNCLTKDYQPSIIFESIKTKERLDKVLVEKFELVLPKMLPIYKQLEWIKRKKCQYEIDEVERHAYIVPFLDNLKALLKNDEVRHYLENPKTQENGLYRTVLDGDYYRENEYFRNHPNALAIIIYYDDLGITNPLGVKSKTHKLSMFYWTIGNIHPQVRSNLNAIQLLAIVKTESIMILFNCRQKEFA